MRRLMHDEDGAAVILIAVVFAILLFSAALVIDGGRLYDERHQLQDGADAVALALAFDCARDETTCLLGADARAQALADENSKDGVSALDPDSALVLNPFIDLVAKTATADLRAQEPGQSAGDGEVTLSQRWPDGTTGSAVRARAIAQWGPISAETTLALTFSECEWDRGTVGGTVWTNEITVYLHDGGTTDPCAGPAHGNAPGQFGWLDGADCIAEIEADVSVGGEPGNDVPQECRDLFHRDSPSPPSLLGTTQLIPIFDSTTGGGNNTEYHVVGFGAIEITGWFLGNQYYAPASHDRCEEPLLGMVDVTIASGPIVAAPAPGNGNGNNTPADLRCIRGVFTDFISLTGIPDPDAPDFGVRSARLIG